MIKSKYWLAPAGFAAMVVVLGLGLQLIFWRSPYTHTNLLPGPNSTFTRSRQILVGEATGYIPPGVSDPQTLSTDPVTRGRYLFVADKCASCHGLKGQGGEFAPPIAGFNVDKLSTKAHTGPGGMPVFSGVTQEDLTSIVAYLNSVTAAMSNAHK